MLYFSLHIALLNPLPYDVGLEILDDLTQFPIHEKFFWRLKELIETPKKDFMLKLELEFQHDQDQDQIFILQKTAWKLGLFASQYPDTFKVHQFIYIDGDVFKHSDAANTDLKLCRL